MKKINLALFLVATCISQTSFSIDLQPNDIVAPSPNKTYYTISFANTLNEDFYTNNSRAAGGHNFENQGTFLRIAQTYTIGSLPGVTYIQTGHANLTTGGALATTPSSSGMTDTVITSAIWPYADRSSRTYLGIAAYLNIPTGEYTNSKTVNIGSNRYSKALQIGFQRPINDSIDLAAAYDVTWYGKNNECAAACSSITNKELTQKPLYSAQIGPIYKLNNFINLSATYIYTTGGETAFNGVYRNNEIETKRYLLGASALTQFGQFTLQYGRDTSIKNGFMESKRLILRYASEF